MKKLLVLLFSIFFLSSPSVFADDISDFQIEGMNVGDSLLDHMTENKILEEINANKNIYDFLNEPNKYAEVYIFKDFQTYDMVSVYLKNNLSDLYIADTNEKYTIPGIRDSMQFVTNINEKYTILGIRGMLPYNEDFDSCIKKRDEIAEVLSGMFPNSDKHASRVVHPADPSGNSITEHINFDFDSGEIANIHCSNWDENYRIKHNYSEGLNVQLVRKEIADWMRDY